MQFTSTVCWISILLASSAIAQTSSLAQAPAVSRTSDLDAPTRLRVMRDDGKRGMIMTSFPDRSPLSRFSQLIARTRLRTHVKPTFYNIEKESFVLYVPKSYDPKKKSGLLIWIAQGPAAVPPVSWRLVLEQRNLIWIGANNASRTKPPHRRLSLALDAAFNARKKYNIDPDRVYIGGQASGGRVASMLGTHYPEVFRGGLYVYDCLYHRALTLIDDPRQILPAGYARPLMTYYFQAKTRSRHVIVANAKASNLSALRTLYKNGFLEDRYRHVHLLILADQTGKQLNGHGFDQAIAKLDHQVPAATQSARVPVP